MQLKEGQWYQLPSGRWVRATCCDDPVWLARYGPILEAYGSSDGPYTVEFSLYVTPEGDLGATGLCTWDTWTLADLREATPDEAELQTRRVAGIVGPLSQEPGSGSA